MNPAFFRKLAVTLLHLILVVLVGGFIAAALVRYSPGFDVDENAWAPKISASTLEAIHARNRVESRLPVFYARYLAAAVRGDFGVSQSFRTPVAELLRERAAVSARLIAGGAAGGLALASLLAWSAVWPRRHAFDLMAASFSGLLIAVPPAVLALFFFFREAPLVLAVSLAIMPRVFSTVKAILSDLHSSPALLVARARGITSVRMTTEYVLRPALPQLLALTGVAMVLAFGFIIPIEALCDVPGVGQLAWKAALARDLPLLSGLALIVTFLVSAVHSIGELAR